MEHKIPVPADVLDGLETVRLSGRTNMLDVPMVVRVALDTGFPETAFWVHENQELYAVGVFKGFYPTERLDVQALSDMAARFLDGEGGGG